MNLSLIFNRKTIKGMLKPVTLVFLTLFLFALPSFEAPKNIFLAGFLIFSIYFQMNKGKIAPLKGYEYAFLIYIASALLSAFLVKNSGGEWKGFRGMFLWTSFALILSRNKYSGEEISWLFQVAIISIIGPLAWSYIEIFILHTKDSLQLHSVGHVNHSAIYLTIIYGATLGFLLKTKINFRKKIIYGAIASFLLASIFIGQSRAAIISAMLITIIAAINLKKNKLNLIVLFLIIASISIKINLGNDLNVIEKIKKTNTAEDALSHRKEIWNTGFEVFRSNELFGIGNGNWKQITPDVIKSSVESRGSKYKEEKYFFAAHAPSLYISNLVERGLLGIFALMSIIVIWAKTLIDSYRRNMLTTEGNFLWLGSLSAFISTFLIGFVNSTFHHENALIALFFFSLHVMYNKEINAK